MNILVLGGDGYLGWPTALHLSALGHDVTVVDNLVRREYDVEMGVDSLVPDLPLEQRVASWERGLRASRSSLRIGDLTDAAFTYSVVAECRARRHRALRRAAVRSVLHDRPGARGLHPGEQRGRHAEPAVRHRRGRPDIHLVKLGTMGEYGYPNIDIEEGFIEITHKGRTDVLPYPKQPGSFYHLSKVHDSANIMFACRVWGLRSTDLNQGIVYGQSTPETDLAPRAGDPVRLRRRLRHGAQPLLRPGRHGRSPADRLRRRRSDPGHAQHPRHRWPASAGPATTRPSAGEFRVFNQFTESFSVRDMAAHGQADVPRPVEIAEGLRRSRGSRSEEHYYRAANTKLLDLGLEPHLLDRRGDPRDAGAGRAPRDRVDVEAIAPTVQWRKRPAPSRRPARPSRTRRSWWSDLGSSVARPMSPLHSPTVVPAGGRRLADGRP